MFEQIKEVQSVHSSLPLYDVAVMNDVNEKLYATVAPGATKLSYINFLSGEVSHMVLTNETLINLGKFIEEQGYAFAPKEEETEETESPGTVVLLTGPSS